jgi:archaellum component FlaC
MSTSPSWFDQEKFSHLVKKVGRKPASGTPEAPARVPPPTAPEKDTRRLARASLAPKAPETLAQPPAPAGSSLPPLDTVIRAPADPNVKETDPTHSPISLPNPEVRSVSPLARRTTPLPNLKPIFEYEKPEVPSAIVGPDSAEAKSESDEEPEEKEEVSSPEVADKPSFPGFQQPSEDLSSGWSSGPSLKDDPFRPKGESETEGAQEMDELLQELEDARNEAALLRAQLEEADKPRASSQASGGDDELTRALEERDRVRRDYAGLREQFETLKHEQVRTRGESGGEGAEDSDQLAELRKELAERDEEINAVKISSIGLEDVIQTLKQELNAVQTQIHPSRDEASIAQRGLALSQKALQETRDALREASESSSHMKTSLENLKNECSTLVQQNIMLQAQNEQLTRELNALKNKGGDRG